MEYRLRHKDMTQSYSFHSDVQAPAFTGCPVSQSVIAPPLEISAVVTWNIPTASDNSGESIPVIQEQGPKTESALQEGDHMIMFTATDSSGNKATCSFTVTVSVVRCSGLSAELPLQVSCLHGNLLGSECSFSCSVGYLLQGSKTSQCLLTGSDGFWDRETPTCQISQCEDPPLLENGGLKIDCNRDYSSTCYFECDVGYEINNDVLTCLAQPDTTTVSWHGELPRCSRIYCTKPQLTIGLEITVSSDCPSGSLVPSGNHCQFVCTEGYHLQGNGDLMCQEDRTWSRAIPTCHLITCKVADIEIPMNALLGGCEVERVNYGKLCTLSCQDGYEATGLKSTDMTCSGDGDDVGTWSGDSIQCNGNVLLYIVNTFGLFGNHH
nr:P-selectin-like [Lytechinus pictus]